MARNQASITDRASPPGFHSRKPSGPSPRERLLAGLPLTERRLRLAGVSTAVLEGGAGPSLVLLHGPGEYGAKWLRVVPDLVSTHRVIAPDLPGHGASAALEDGENGADGDGMLDWLEDLIACTCRTPPVLVGHVVGGAVAARFAAARDERLGALVLVDALGLAAFQPTPEFGRALAQFNAAPNEATHDDLWSRCAFDLPALRTQLGERWEWIKAYNLDRARAPDRRRALQALMERYGLPAIPAADLTRIAVPTSLIWGRHDLATPLPVAQAASGRYGWPLYVIDGAADDPAMERPEAFVRALRAALGPRDAEARPARRTGHPPASWDAVAPLYDRSVTATHESLGGEGIRRVGLREGLRFLDVAAGSGALSLPAARTGARVLATDRSPVMLDFLGARARREGLDIETRVMDGEALDLPDDAFDVVGSQFGVMLFADMPKGIREMVRVATPGGRVLLHAYGDPREIEFLQFLIAAVRAVRPGFAGLPTDPGPLEFQLADPRRMRRELRVGGLTRVRVETAVETTEFASGQALWDWLRGSNPIVEAMLESLGLTEDERKAVGRDLERQVRARAGSGPTARLTSPINIGIGTK